MAVLLYPPPTLGAWVRAEPTDGEIARPSAEFLEQCISHHARAIALGELARHRGDRPDTRQFGRMSVKEHTHRMAAAVATLARLEDRSPPRYDSSLDMDYKRLMILSGGAFDAEYKRTALSHHSALISILAEAAQSNVPAVRTYAQESMPVAMRLFNMARAVPNRYPEIPASRASTQDAHPHP
jgi:uncharacterized protein (DUF305 family)